jgi:hypothetical protein
MSYMTFTPTRKQAEALRVIHEAGEVRSIYALAQMLNRPYRRVLDHVRELEAAGLVHVDATPSRSGRAGKIRPGTKPGHSRPKPQPTLSYPRHWSSPVSGVSDDVLIAGVITEPTLGDLIACCAYYGVKRVRSVYSQMLTNDEIPAAVQRSVGRMLANVEIGFSRAAYGPQHAGDARIGAAVPRVDDCLQAATEQFIVATKAHVLADKLMSRDLFDLRTLIETGRCTFAELLEHAEAMAASTELIRERLVNGLMNESDPPVNRIDGLAVSVDSLRHWFVEAVNEYERAVAMQHIAGSRSRFNRVL